MEQYHDKDDKRWHITLSAVAPSAANIKNKLNFRLHSVIMTDGSIIKDPDLLYSKYIFQINKLSYGKKLFFKAAFNTSQIYDIATFRFGFCDEMVRWFNATIFNIENKCPLPDFPITEKGPESIIEEHQKEELVVILLEEGPPEEDDVMAECIIHTIADETMVSTVLSEAVSEDISLEVATLSVPDTKTKNTTSVSESGPSIAQSPPEQVAASVIREAGSGLSMSKEKKTKKSKNKIV